MRIAPPVSLSARPNQETPRWELVLRYIAATAATLIAIAGAQLVISNMFAGALTAVTVLGVPVSLYLRVNDMRLGSFRIPKAVWNGVTVTAAVAASLYFILWSLKDLVGAALAGASVGQAFWLRFSAGDTVGLLMQVFLVFAACRSFALISDKDTTLSTVPSFSVLLLLIPIHKGVEVVIYFLVWTVLATVLFALDHRGEGRLASSGYVPSPTPGQDVRLSARSLATILGISLISALGLSYFLSSRDPEERSKAETAVSDLASRLTQYALSLPDVSVNSGPERQIDFSSGPTLPSKSQLWRGQATTWGYDSFVLHPNYWRMFTLTTYDGSTWSQGPARIKRVQRTELARQALPPTRRYGPRTFRGPRRPINGFNVGRVTPELASQFGEQVTPVVVRMRAQVANLGYAPVLPQPRLFMLPDSEQNEVRVRDDGAIDLGVIQPGQTFFTVAFAPLSADYGLDPSYIKGRARQLGQIQPPQLFKVPPPVLSSMLRKDCLQLPSTLPKRVRDFAAQVLKGREKESAARKAERLALALQDGATYTLRPPSIPDGRDATDYFLFEGRKRGYCTYFAGALTVLCRTQGIPARVVSGFANAEWTRDSHEAIIREANAHAWTEVWVEGQGWKLVDATPPDDRGDNAPTWLENWGDMLGLTADNLVVWVQEHMEIVIVMGTVLAGGAFLLMRRRRLISMGMWRLNRGGQTDANRKIVVASYSRAALQLTRRFRPRAPWETADEWLEAALDSLKLADEAGIRRLNALYLASMYNPGQMADEAAAEAKELSKKLSWKKQPSPPKAVSATA